MQRRDLPPTPVSGIDAGIVDAATVFASPRVASLWAWWHGLVQSKGHLPLWHDFDITDHATLAPYLFVVETPADGAFRFRLLGEVVIGMIGRNNVGELVQSRPSDDYGHELYRYYQDIVQQRDCRWCRGTLAFAGSEHRRFEAIDCPTADDTGRVTRIIGVMDYIN
ncbi:MAG TPA: PAS domain-containing protein [Dongiaceae bacterium]